MSDDAIISFAQRLKQRDDIAVGNVGSALTSPDKAGRANVLARDFSVPTDFAERNLDALEREARRGGAVDLIARYPGVADWFANPRNAAVATDDIGSLATVAKTLKRRVPGQAAIENEVPPVANFRNFFKGVWTNLVEGGKSAKAGFSAIAADIVPAPTRRSGIPQLGDFALENAMQRRARAQLAIDAARPDFGSGWKARTLSGLYSGTASAAQMAPAIGFGMLTSGAGGALALAAPVGLDAYGKYRSRGASPSMAGIGASGEAAVEAVTEVLPMSFIVNKLGRAGFSPFVAGLLGREIPGEQIATLAQDAIDTAIANPDKTWAEYWAERPDAAYQTLVATLVPGVLAGGASEAARRLHLREQERQAETDADFLQRLAGNVTESKVAKRDPSAFAKFLELQAQGTPVENVYIPGDKLAEFFQSADMDYRGDDSPFSFDPGIADQIDEAVATGGDVVIPTAQFAAQLAGSPVWEAVKDHVRLSPGGLSLAEARDSVGAQAAAMEQMGSDFARQLEEDRAAREPAEKLYQSIRDKLTAAGFTQNAADVNASLLAARYATRAARKGEALTGAEFDAVTVNQVLPERLAPIVAADQLDLVIDAMKRRKAQRSDRQKFGPSLLEWIAAQGGIEDKGGDLAAMGADAWHKGKPGRRKLIRPTADQAPTLIPMGRQNVNTPDELALRAQEAGYFPVGDRPTINDLLEAVDSELRGKPRYAEDRSGTTDQVREAADELEALLEQEGLDPANASKADIRKAVERYQAERSEGRGYDQRPVARLSGDELGRDLSADNVSERAKAYFKEKLQGTTVSRDGVGEIRFSDKGFKKLKRGLRVDLDRARLIPATADIIKKGDYLGRAELETERSDSIVAFHYFRAAVDIGGRTIQAGVTVGEDRAGNLFYNLVRDPKALFERKKGAPASPRSEARGPAPAEDIGENGSEINVDTGRSLDQSPTNSAAFRNWFRDSKVVDARGAPLVVYHGTAGDIERFDSDRRGENTGAESAGMGFFFSEDKRTAESYANYAATDARVSRLISEAEAAEQSGDWDAYDAKVVEYETLDASFANPENRLAGQNVVPVYLSIQNPLRVDAKGENAVGFDIPAAIRKAIQGAHDGLIIENLDDAAGLVNQEATHFVVFKPEQIKSVNNQGTFDPGDSRILHQSFMDGPRGRITFLPDGRSVIDLFQARDPSTFLHESAHLWLEELRQDAQADGATDQVKADWQAVQDWFAAKGHALTDGAIPVDAHEMWARGVERFLMEGKAPSSALRRVFDTFRAWLTAIYQVVTNLRSPVTPEIRDVMARLIATDAEIEEARDEQYIKALWSTATVAGMSEPVFAEYQKLTQDARDEAHDALLYRVMSTIRRERTKAWREERDAVRAEVEARVNARPEFRALALMRMKGSGVRLDRAWLIENYGQDALALLPGGVPPIYGENGTAADEIAEMAGFANGDEMVRTLMAVGQRKAEMTDAGDKRSVRQAMIEDETAAIMRDRHGDPLSDGSIEEEALALIHNERQGEVIASELRELGKRSNRRPTPYALARQWAAETIAQSKVADSLSGAALQRYARAARNAAKLAEEAMLAGNVDETFRQKQRQMLNNALVAEAGKAKALIDAAATRLSKVAKRATMRSVDQDYLDQAHALLEHVDFRPRSQRSIDRQESFEAWAAAREAEGFDVVVPASFEATLGQEHWSRLTVERLLGLRDAVDQILHLGRLKRTLIDNKERREFDAVVAEAVDAAGKLPPRPPSDLMQPDWADRFKAGVASFDAGLLRIETLVDWLDGGRSDGVFNRIVFRPIAEAQDRENDMRGQYQQRVVEAMQSLPLKTTARWQERVTAPELINRETGNPWQLSRQQLVAMALNMGNEGNIQRLTDGYGWSEQAVRDVLDRELRAEDWAFVQQVWDIIDTLWPQIAAMEKRVNGIEPERVEAKGFTNAHGSFRGGYYPVVYDSAKSVEAEVHQGKAGDLFETVYTRAATRASATKNRMEKVQRPVLLDLGVINRHLGEVIHDLTHREAIMQAARFLDDRRVVKAIDDSLGPEYRKQFRPWLKFVANQWAMERVGNEGVGKIVNRLRANATVVGMGFRIGTIITQIAGYSNSAEYVGARWVAEGIARVAASPIETFRFVMERSGEIRHRMDSLDRDIRLGLNQLAGRNGLVAEVSRFAFHGIGLADRIVVIPTWIGAYNKALAGGASEEAAIYEADKSVRKSQGSGSAKDLAAVQRGTGKAGELMKLLTMFYSYMSALYQRQRTLGRDVASAGARDVPALAARALWLVIIPPVLTGLLTGRGPEDDEDWSAWAFKNMLFNSLGPIPGIRDLVQPVWQGLTGERGFDYQLSPLQRVGQSIVNVAKDVGNLIEGDETKRATRNALETAGYVTGLVPGQIAATTQFLVDVAEGDQDPETVADWWEGLTKGKVSEE